MPVECITFGIMDPWWMPQDLPICKEQLVLNTTADVTRKSIEVVLTKLKLFQMIITTERVRELKVTFNHF